MEDWTVTDLVRHNVRRLRGDESLRELAARLSYITGDKWTRDRLSDIEGGRTGRNRTISPDEMVALARAFAVPLHELFLPPDDGVRIRSGRGFAEGGDWFQLTFWYPKALREQFTERVLFGRIADGRPSQNSHLEFLLTRIEETMGRVLEDEDLVAKALARGDAQAFVAAVKPRFIQELGDTDLLPGIESPRVIEMLEEAFGPDPWGRWLDTVWQRIAAEKGTDNERNR